MNREILISFVLILSVVINGFSQLERVRSGNELAINNPKSILTTNLLSSSQGYNIVEIDAKYNKLTETSKGSYKIHHFDKNLNYTNSKTLDLPYHSEKNKILHFSISNDNLIFISNEKNKKERKSRLYLHRYDPLTLAEIAPPKLFHESRMTKGLFEDFTFHFKVSPDSSKLLIFEYHELNDGNQEFNFCILDEKFDIHKKNIFFRKKLIKGLSISSLSINNEGQVFILQKKIIKKGDRAVVVSLLHYDSESKELKDYEVLLEKDKYISSARIIYLEDGDPLIVGHYANKKGKYAGGVFHAFFPVDEKKTITLHTAPYSRAFIILKERVNLSDHHMNNYYLQDVRLNKKGNLIFLDERLNVKEHIRRPNDMRPDFNTYEYERILYTEYDYKNNKILKAEKILKNQEYKSKLSHDFYWHFTNDNLFLIFNDHSKNKYKSKRKKAREAGGFLGKKSSISLVKIDSNNQINFVSSLNMSEKKTINPRFMFKSSPNRFIYINYQSKTVTLEEYEFQ